MAVIVKFKNNDNTWTFHTNTDNNNTQIITTSKKMNFDYQEDRDDFCSICGAPLGMTREEFNQYFNENPLYMMEVVDSDTIKRFEEIKENTK